MGYSMPIVCKEMYLPINYKDSLSLSEYKDKYGIDLSKYIELNDEPNNHTITLNLPLYTKIYVCSDGENFSYAFNKIIFATGYSVVSSRDEGNDAQTVLGAYDANETAFVGILFTIPNGDDMTLENITIGMRLF